MKWVAPEWFWHPDFLFQVPFIQLPAFFIFQILPCDNLPNCQGSFWTLLATPSHLMTPPPPCHSHFSGDTSHSSSDTSTSLSLSTLRWHLSSLTTLVTPLLPSSTPPVTPSTPLVSPLPLSLLWCHLYLSLSSDVTFTSLFLLVSPATPLITLHNSSPHHIP